MKFGKLASPIKTHLGITLFFAKRAISEERPIFKDAVQ